MQFIRNFEQLYDHLSAPGKPRVKVAVACPYDESTLGAVGRALELGVADFILVGEPAKMSTEDLEARFSERVQTVACADPDAAAAEAVALVRRGEADVLMKGLLNTDNLLRAILNKEHGILTPGAVLTHVTATEIPGTDRLLMFSDAAVIPFPTEAQRIAMVKAVVRVCRKLGIGEPRVALVHCTEKTSPKFPVTLDYARLRELCAEGEFGNAIVDGPMDVKTACDSHSGAVKGIDSPIDGRADGLIFPDIESGNVFYKTVTCFCHALNAGMLAGASVPVVLPSRSDDAESKLASLALACVCAGN